MPEDFFNKAILYHANEFWSERFALRFGWALHSWLPLVI
jgi:hypothetical protein